MTLTYFFPGHSSETVRKWSKHQSPRITHHKLPVGISYSEYRCIRGSSWSLSKGNDLDLLFPCHGSGNSPKMASNTSSRAITLHKLLVGTSYSEYRCIRSSSSSLSKGNDIDLLFPCHGSGNCPKMASNTKRRALLTTNCQ